VTQRLADVDLTQRFEDEDEYKQRLHKAQLELLLLQGRLKHEKRRAVIAVEGWDAAGKGGAIKRVIQHLDPRGYVVHSIAAPDALEKAEHYLQRFWRRLPRGGAFSIFDRTWYGRVLVERIEKFCSKAEWKRAYDEINAFEKALADDGVPVVKMFLHISKKEQKRRFEDRAKDPFAVWKLNDEDWRNRAKWDDYEVAIDEMLARTDQEHAPWRLVAADYKWFARVEVLEACVERLARFFGWKIALPKGWKESAP
jgi:polyphosphate kinase 2 (PPK2 family)